MRRKQGRCDFSEEAKQKNDRLYGYMEILQPTGQYYDEKIGHMVTTYPRAAAHGVLTLEDVKCLILTEA